MIPKITIITTDALKLYIPHAVNMYDTNLEEALLHFIGHSFSGSVIENPNQPHHQEGYNKWSVRQRESDTKHKGMSYFFDEVLPGCNGCVTIPYLDGKMGLGVASETKWFIARKFPVWVVQFKKDQFPGPIFIRKLTNTEIELLKNDDPQLVVPHEGTRLRTWLVYNREKRPFESAHLAPTEVYPGFYPEEK